MPLIAIGLPLRSGGQVDPVLAQLFEAFPDAVALSRADRAEVEMLIRPLDDL